MGRGIQSAVSGQWKSARCLFHLLSIVLYAAFVASTPLHAAPGSTTYIYDEAGRLKTTIYQDSANRTYTLDAAGNRTQTTQSAGNGFFVLSSATYSVAENAGTLTLTVTRNGSTSGAVSVTYATSNGSAVAGSDYTTTTSTLSWATGVGGSQTFTVPILNDAIQETAETFTITLSAPTGGAIVGTPDAATVTITDDDDTTLPSAPGTPSFSAIAESTATATWSAATDNFGVTGYRYRLNAGAWVTLGNVLTVNLTGLTAATGYTFELQARDAAGNWGPSASNSFTTANPPLPVAPVWTGASVACTASPWCHPNGSMTLTWAAGSGGGTPTRYDVYATSNGVNYGLVQSNAATSYVATAYTYWVGYVVAACNATGCISSSVPAWLLQDAPPSAPGALTYPSITSSSATVSWGAATDDVGVTAYRYYVNNGAWQYPGNVLSVNLTGLSQITTYTVVVQAGDGIGQWGGTTSGSFTTPYGAPTAPSNLTATGVSGTQINLSWTASTSGTGYYNYYIYRNGALVGYTTNTTSYADTGLSPGTTYNYVVHAYDYYTQLGPAVSNTASGTTQPPTADNASMTVGYFYYYYWDGYYYYFSQCYGYQGQSSLGSYPMGGAYSPATLTGGKQVVSFSDCDGITSSVAVKGFTSDPGVGWLNWASSNGITLTGTSASYYYYSGGEAWWSFATPFGFVNRYNSTIPAAISHP